MLRSNGAVEAACVIASSSAWLYRFGRSPGSWLHERRRLQKASAVLLGAALAAEEGINGRVVADAVSAARELIDAAIDTLDSVRMSE